jgi:hypothetical protein
MGRNNEDFDEGKDHIISWQMESGDTAEQRFPSLAPGADKKKAVGKHLANYGEAKPAKGSKVNWKAV